MGNAITVKPGVNSLAAWKHDGYVFIELKEGKLLTEIKPR